MINLSDHFTAKVRGAWQKEHLDYLFVFTNRVPIGRILLNDFFESKGKIKVAAKIDKGTARGQYTSHNNTIILAENSTSTDLIHELAHARQFRKAPQLNERMSILDHAHLITMLEGDAWALSMIYWKEFITNYSDSASWFLKKEGKAFIHLMSVHPTKFFDILSLDEDPSAKSLVEFMRTHAKINSPRTESEVRQDLYDPDTDAKWAGDMFKQWFDFQHTDGTNSFDYISRDLIFSAEKLAELRTYSTNPRELNWCRFNFSMALDAITNLEDLGIEACYLDDYKQEGNYPDWALIPNNKIAERFEEIYNLTFRKQRGYDVIDKVIAAGTIRQPNPNN